MIDTTDTVTAHVVPEADRANFVHGLFGIHFPMHLEPAIFGMAAMLARDYRGGFWQFHALSNGDFFMAPESTCAFDVRCENGFESSLSAEALGITACLYAYSHLSFAGDGFAETVAEHYQLLRDFAMGHQEVGAILAAID